MIHREAIDFNDNFFKITLPFHENWRAKQAPAVRWDRVNKVWKVPPTRAAAFYLIEEFDPKEFTNAGQVAASKYAEPPVFTKTFPNNFLMKGAPMVHQKNVLDRAWEPEHFAIYHAMGTGKTYSMIQLASARWMADKIDTLLVVCPSSIRYSWQEQLEEWSNIPIDPFIVEAGPKLKLEKWIDEEHLSQKLKVLIVGVEALSATSSKAFPLVKKFVRKYKCMTIVDESSRIKNYRAIRTKKVIELGDKSAFRCIATGTSITQGMEDLYSQFRFLDWRIIGQKTYTGFRNRYCVMGGFEGRQVIGYRKSKELMNLIGPYVHVVKKEEALDLPPATWTHRDVQATGDQKKAIKDLKEMLRSEVGTDKELTIQTILERMMRFQQIAGGFMPYDIENDDGTKSWGFVPFKTNPKLEALLEITEETNDKMIIWANFVPEIEAIEAVLNQRYPGQVQSFYGKTVDKKGAIERFRKDPNCRFFVSRQSMGGIGLNLIEATLMVYFSNTFSYEDRVQSRDRMHRKGQEMPVTYIDLWINLPIDTVIRNAIEAKSDLADMVNDAMQEVMR